MKNYIANGKGDWATSAAFVKYSFERSIHYGRLYTNGTGLFKGKDEDLAEALRLLGQGLHCLEDFGAHSNYVELSLLEQGYHNVFCHTGTATQIDLHGKRVFPLVTGTFGMVDFYHSVLGEATDHFTQSEVNEMDNAFGIAQTAAQSSNPLTTLIKLLAKVPGTRELCAEAQQLQQFSNNRARELGMPVNEANWYEGSRAMEDVRVSQPDYSTPEAVYPDQQQGGLNQAQWNSPQHPQSFNMDTGAYPAALPQYPDQGDFQPQHYDHQNAQSNAPWSQQPPHSVYAQQQESAPNITPQPTPSQPQQTPSAGPTGLPSMPDFDAAATIKQIYPILAFRDKVVRTISAIIEKIPGLEALVERITETLTVFILSLLAPFVRPVLNGITIALKSGSGAVVDASKDQQFFPWTDPNCTDPTHSLLSKDHFSNVLNEPAGAVASSILTFIAPRVLYAWEHPDVPLSQIGADIEKVFHHPAIRDQNSELHNHMFDAVAKWARGCTLDINSTLGSESVKAGKNHKGDGGNPHMSGQVNSHQNQPAQFNAGIPGQQQSHAGGGAFGQIGDMISGFTGGSHGSHGQQSSGGIGGMLSSFASGGQQHHQSSGLGDVLNLAAKLPIPGVQGMAQKYNKYSKYAHMIPGMRELDSNDISAFGEVGGRRELMEAEATAESGEQISRGTSPLPPAGYEAYANRGEYQPG